MGEKAVFATGIRVGREREHRGRVGKHVTITMRKLSSHASSTVGTSRQTEYQACDDEQRSQTSSTVRWSVLGFGFVAFARARSTRSRRRLRRNERAETIHLVVDSFQLFVVLGEEVVVKWRRERRE